MTVGEDALIYDGNGWQIGDGPMFGSHDPATGEVVCQGSGASCANVDAAAAAAAAAYPILRDQSPRERATLLQGIADALEDAREELIRIADAETALGEPRLNGELGRTTGQLRAFAEMVLDGRHHGAIIDRGDPSATPPRPDLRRCHRALGPVGVFGASNFPFAFGVAGGDTASALAAGCPVVAKGHPSHAGTSRRIATSTVAALEKAGAPPGAFTLLQGADVAVGEALVDHPLIAAIGFTGSLRGGRALFDRAAARPTPIPVYAEMGSTNPVFVTEGALKAREDEIAGGLAASFTLGVGQFCTKPGVVFVAAADAVGLGERAANAAAGGPADGGVMLNGGLATAFAEGVNRFAAIEGVAVMGAVPLPMVAHGDGLATVRPIVASTDLATYLRNPSLGDECFGPSTVIVACGDDAGLRTAAMAIDGSLTATIHAEPHEGAGLRPLVESLADRVGRLVWNGFPTGVAVTDAMHHGGPYPATTASTSTSVGATAVARFLRPVSYQDSPDALLPPSLQNENPLGIWRLVDREWTRAAVGS